MKIHLDNVNVSAKTGPNTFAKRLAKAFFESGHEVILNSGKDADVSIVFIEPSGLIIKTLYRVTYVLKQCIKVQMPLFFNHNLIKI
jgi:hypothetical protein